MILLNSNFYFINTLLIKRNENLENDNTLIIEKLEQEVQKKEAKKSETDKNSY